ncbi:MULTISPECIES: DUF3224 domain-containing protein [unclassified Streptomyces]|uniref:DUF3224 domain-containing protein n=1 Tax=unclassified Streptomyces TaxID=2593676 RepID=UPI002252ED2D|nr:MULTISPECIES: DUF3224 domain-containing protein [unclassified Streptomyces]MCX4536960.1 DUF3224 domain-containing protein [Streptomyces sp. NBC_01669]WRZ97789.1 DUF3224 domain-containing protein [Streptomyces sp. NBC_00841]WSJ99503.1 DUF3224 domain-containing protein [Streptomyces sp. NBC_01320]
MNWSITRAAGVVALALTASVLAATPGSAADSQILSHYYDPGTEIVPSTDTVCAPGGTAIHGSATFGTQPGDVWQGTTTYDYCLYPESTPGQYRYVGTETLTGSAEGCGSGSFTWIGRGSTAGGGTWRIIRGSGTGDLADARGSGTNTATTSPTLENYGHFRGVFDC